MSEDLILPIILQLLGEVVIIAEIIIPSGGLLALIASCLFGYSLYIVFTSVSISVGLMFLCADVITIPILVIMGLKLLAKSPVTLRKSLKSEDGVTSQPHELDELQGMEGTTVTLLRPSGTAIINGKRVDVVSRGEIVEKDISVVVLSVTGNQVIVKQI